MAVLVVRPGTGDEQQEQPARHPVASTTMQPRISAVVFDLGGVLIDWDPRYLYRTLFDDEVAMEEFLATVTTQEWNRAQDAGRPWADAVEELADPSP